MASLKSFVFALIELAKRWPWLIAGIGFISGLASYFLVERKESLAQVIAILMLVSWVFLVLENWLRESFKSRFGLNIPPALMHYLTQLVHQESLFFVLPFFLAVTTWNHTQAGFTALLILCALISVIDPLYYKQLAPRRSLFVIFHALALFAVLLVALPILLQLTTGQSLAFALIASLLFSLPSLVKFIANGRWWRRPLMMLMLAALAAVLWQVPSLVPPAALRLTEFNLVQQVDREQRTHSIHINRLDVQSLKRDGIYAWTAIRAPRGLQEKIHHLWIHNGKQVDRITLNIEGGSEQGYRAWTQKLNFPEDPVGKWQVKVVTDSGQLIGIKRFTVEASIDERESLLERLKPPFFHEPIEDQQNIEDTDDIQQPENTEKQESLYERLAPQFIQEMTESQKTPEESEKVQQQESTQIQAPPEEPENTEELKSTEEQENVEQKN
ncbi:MULTISPECIES: DUF5924 family protein [unclassified Methylophaga]|uniref:DUF5924 family protein n=1 Tax=unclassified Methylophaga TaxID=2629249 RepID=UPI000C0DB54E|nr:MULTISPECIES: DUF5924 family protein [unclassified Methylophaga]MBL1458701.1 DUF2914 domain-containing protein [Methylophaga sp.]|tara:strand:- start:2748 stop:4073 length:1326 start_codon:yes stop_codon:yes gene_type:complete